MDDWVTGVGTAGGSVDGGVVVAGSALGSNVTFDGSASDWVAAWVAIGNGACEVGALVDCSVAGGVAVAVCTVGGDVTSIPQSVPAQGDEQLQLPTGVHSPLRLHSRLVLQPVTIKASPKT